MATIADSTPAPPDLAALDSLTEAVESGAGLPEVVRAASRLLDASLVLIDRTSQILAVAARSPAEEQSLLAGGDGIETIELRLADEEVGQLRARLRGESSPAMLRLVTALIASEVERVRAPQRASAMAVTAFIHGVLSGEIGDDAIAGADELGSDIAGGAVVLVIRDRPHVPVEDGWRARVLAIIERGARAAAAGTLAASSDRVEVHGTEIVAIVPGDDTIGERTADAILRELQASLPGYTFSLGRSRATSDPADLRRAGMEAQLAANVSEGDTTRPILAFEDTGTYKLLLGQDPGELQRFYDETIATLVAYDDQYETELVGTVEAFLDADGNVAATSQRLFTHRHTVRYRLDRVKELTGLDVGSTDGREKLSLGLKAMRVLGIAPSAGPASEAGTEAGRVPRRLGTRPPVAVGIVTGSGTYALPGFDAGRPEEVETPFGSALLTAGAFAGVEVLHISRHRPRHPLLSSQVTHQANVWALRERGATCVLAVTVCGALDPGLDLGSLIVFDDLHFLANRLPDGSLCTLHTEPGAPGRGHWIFDTPFSEPLRQALLAGARDAGQTVRDGGCYGHVDGPRFNTRTEIRTLAAAGVTAVSQTAGPETVLCGEAELPYALVGFATDYANGIPSEPTPVAELVRLIGASTGVFASTLAAAVPLAASAGAGPVGTHFRFD